MQEAASSVDTGLLTSQRSKSGHGEELQPLNSNFSNQKSDLFIAYGLDKRPEIRVGEDDDLSLFDPSVDCAEPTPNLFYTSGESPKDDIELDIAAPARDMDDLVNLKGFTYNSKAKRRRGALKGTRPEAKTQKLREAWKGKKLHNYVEARCPEKFIKNGDFWLSLIHI